MIPYSQERINITKSYASGDSGVTSSSSAFLVTKFGEGLLAPVSLFLLHPIASHFMSRGQFPDECDQGGQMFAGRLDVAYTFKNRFSLIRPSREKV